MSSICSHPDKVFWHLEYRNNDILSHIVGIVKKDPIEINLTSKYNIMRQNVYECHTKQIHTLCDKKIKERNKKK